MVQERIGRRHRFPYPATNPLRMGELSAKLGEQFQESAKLEVAIRENLRGVGYEF